jgi:RNA polymerase sigma-70 factor
MPASSSTELVSSSKMKCPPVAAWIAAHERARRSWTTVQLSFDQFLAHVERLGWGQLLPGYPEALYLSAACNLGIESACIALERTYFPHLKFALSQQRTPWDFTEEVLQRTRERLLVGPQPRIGSYRGDGPLPAWLMVVARRVAQDLRRDDSKHRRLISWELQDCPNSAVGPDSMREGCLERALDSTWIQHVERAVRLAIDSLASADRRLLHLHYVGRCSATQLAQALEIDRATVYRRLRRVECDVARFVRRHLQETLGGLDRDVLEELLHASYASVRLDDYFSSAARERAS